MSVITDMTEQPSARNFWEERQMRQEEREANSNIVLEGKDKHGKKIDIVIPKGLVYDVFHGLRKLKDETHQDACWHISAGTKLETDEAKIFIHAIGFRTSCGRFNDMSDGVFNARERDNRDDLVKKLVDTCMIMDPGPIFNEDNILAEHLTPNERGMIDIGIFNIVKYKELMSRMAEEAALAAKMQRYDENPPEYVPAKPHLKRADAPKGLPKELLGEYVSLGMDPEKAEQYFNHMVKSIRLGKKPLPMFYFFKHTDGGLAKPAEMAPGIA